MRNTEPLYPDRDLTAIKQYLGSTKPPLWIRRIPNETWNGDVWITDRKVQKAAEKEAQTL